ncbi:hypothetical protein FB45DRAFT_1067820 [Roridomyces roridus]|uniref:NmrA-like domain-containing protein n=1 Tax=Roridomyces roridus TaxID=1738132 RepID=A0AAD7B1W2_9AGAR|nr:hypothetical protein FB45DRAFT_1067820 [Roridomyces roridus]
MSSITRIVAVFGATGLQGSAIVEALLRDGKFTPRAITRNPTSDAALKLKERGVQVVQGETADRAGLVSALQGSEAAFAVTVPRLPPFFSAEGPTEVEQGKNMIDAAKEAGVKFFVFSSLPSIKRISGGKYTNVAHYDDKEEIETYLKASGLANASLLLGGFSDGLWAHGFLKKTPTGRYAIGIPKYIPNALEAHTWVGHDLGEAVLALLRNYDDPLKSVSGKSYPVVTANLSWEDMGAAISKALGAPVDVTFGEGIGIPAYDEMFTAHAEYNGLYAETPVPNPELAALGAKIGDLDALLTEIKKRFS